MLAQTTLNNGVEMPYFGLGVYQLKEGDEIQTAIHCALDAGYRHFDTAALYYNEAGVGKAINSHPIDRKEVFVTSKVWNSDQGYDNTLKAFDVSMDKLGFDYLDLYLIHWPVKGMYKDTWKALETIYKAGRVKAIGVSNFLQNHLEDVLAIAEFVPSVNQMEFHPYLVQQKLIDFCQQHQIQYEAWSPLMQGKILDVSLLKSIGEKYQKNPVQVVLRWNLQKGVATIPKSSKPHRIIENADIFDFALTPAEVHQIDALDRAQRIGPDPNTFDF